MTRPLFDLADRTLSGDERLATLLALSRGTHAALQALLQNVRSYQDLIADDVEGHPAAEGYLQNARQLVDRALLWLDAYGQTVAGSEDTDKVDLRPLLEGVVQRCRRILPEGLALTVENTGEPAIVDCAVFQLQETLLDILEGCAEALPAEAGALTVRVDQVQLSQGDTAVLRCQCAPGLYGVIHLHAGPGEVFRPGACLGFWDGMARLQGSDAATDLRLLHAAGVFQAHGGELFFGRDGAAPILAIALPIEAKRKDMQVEPDLDDAELLGNETILLVDDEDMIWDVITDMLQELGYSVILAGNGLEAVEIYRDNPGAIDLVMLDMLMPELDGHDAFFQLKAIDPKVRVLLSSGYVSEDDARDVLDAGAVGFLQKPYRMVDLARRIRAIFAQPRP